MKKVLVLLVLSMFALSTSLLAQVWPPTNLTYQVQSQENVVLNWDAPQNPNDIILNYDNGMNDDSIGTGGAADFDVAIRFEPSQIAAYDGYHLTMVDFFPSEAACTYSIRVWQGANAATMLVDQAVTAPTIGAWNSVQLTSPVEIDASQELWIGYRNNTQAGYPAGCDAGPAVTGYGDMILFQGAWASMNEAYGLNYNWNIQGHISMPTKSEVAIPLAHYDSITDNTPIKIHPFKLGNTTFSNSTITRDFIGYNVYRNGSLLADMVSTTTYSDMGLADGTYTYYVTADYDEGESDPTNTVEVIIQVSATDFFTAELPDSPEQQVYPNNTNPYGNSLTDLGWTTFEVPVSGQLLSVQMNLDWLSVDYPSEGSLWIQGPEGAAVEVYASTVEGQVQTLDLPVDLGTMGVNGTWSVWMEDSFADGGHQVTNGSVTIEYVLDGPPQYGTLNGHVYDEFDTPLVGATVQAGTHTATTMAGGMFEFAQIPVGTYDVTASMTGYSPVTEEDVVIILDETTMVDFYLPEYVEELDPPVNLTADVDEDDVTLNWLPPGGGGEGDEIDEDFETGDVPAGWTTIDEDGDGSNWFAYEYDPHGGTWCMASASWWQSVVLTPDNYLVSPQLTLGGTSELRFWAAAQDPAYPSDHYKVKLSTTGTNPADFTELLFEETLSSEVWHEVVIDLSTYAGQMVYLTWQHTDSVDWFVMKLDDISVMNTTTREVLFAADFEKPADYAKFSNPSKKYETTRELTGYNIYQDGTYIGNTSALTYTDENVANGEYLYSVTAVYDEGESDPVDVLVTVDFSNAPSTDITLVTALESVYPNPFNPSTTIKFATSESGHVTIDVYNVKGQRVTTLVDERMDQGNHSIIWNGQDASGKDVTSGIYFSKMRSGKYTATKKMILMK